MTFITEFNNIMWGWVLAVILLGTGLLYGITMGFPQVRCFGHIIRSLKSTLKSDEGSVSGFAALCAAVGGQVGTGSLVGVASALAAGGPGALFWMWITAVFGMVLSFGEATLGQVFHEKDKDGNYYGGSPYYMTKGLGNKPLAIAYAVTTIFAVGVCIAMLQNNSITSAVTGVVNISPWIPGIIVTIITAVIVLGGVKRITDAASLIVPFMAVGYILITIIIIITHLSEVPAMFGTFMTTIIICSCTGVAILLTGALESGQDGVNLVQAAFSSMLGQVGSYFVLLVTFLFCFTTLIADLFYGEVGVRYLFKGSANGADKAVKVFQVIALILVTIGAALPLPVLWDLVDFCVAFLVFFNVYALLRLRKYVKYVLDDYLMQFNSGKSEPVWDESVDITEKCK